MYAKYNTVGQHPHIPKQAFLFIPHRQQTQKQRDDFRIGQKKDIRRLLFEGWAEETYTPYELEKLKQLDDYIARKNLKFDQRWDRSWRLRWLLSTGCKIKKTIEDMHIFTKYQDSVQELTFTSEIEKYLKQGIYYMAGRDSHYRPIFVFDVQKIIKLDMSDELILETQTYFFQYALRNLLIPGQVQNWVTVIDAAETGLMSLIGSMKKSFGFLSDTYRSRMFVCYVCRVPSSLSFIWRVVKGFLEEQTVKKINFFDDQTIEPLMEFCNPEQVQVKFGGILPNLKQGQFWPPRQVSPNYQCSKTSTKLITQAQYSDFYQNKVLYNTKFQQAFIQVRDTSSPLSPQLIGGTQYNENKQKQTVLKLQQHFRKQFNNLQQEVYQIPLLYMPRPPNYKHLVRISRQLYEKEDIKTK